MEQFTNAIMEYFTSSKTTELDITLKSTFKLLGLSIDNKSLELLTTMKSISLNIDIQMKRNYISPINISKEEMNLRYDFYREYKKLYQHVSSNYKIFNRKSVIFNFGPLDFVIKKYDTFFLGECSNYFNFDKLIYIDKVIILNNGNIIIYSRDEGFLRVFTSNLQFKGIVKTPKLDINFLDVLQTERGEKIFIGFRNGDIQMWNSNTLICESVFKGLLERIEVIKILSPGNKFLSICFYTPYIFKSSPTVWNLDGEILFTFTKKEDILQSNNFHLIKLLSEEKIVTIEGNQINIWNSINGVCENNIDIECHYKSISLGTSIIYLSAKNKLYSIDLITQKSRLINRNINCGGMKLSLDNTQIISWWRNFINIYNLETGELEHSYGIKDIEQINTIILLDYDRMIIWSYDEWSTFNIITGEKEYILGCPHVNSRSGCIIQQKSGLITVTPSKIELWK